MEMVSKAHHYGVSRRAKLISRRMLSRVMEQLPKTSRPSRKRSMEVHVMYEPSRLAQQNLQDAYASLVPTVRRRVGQARPTAKPAQSSAERKAQ
jgi:hypothetical protein